MHPIQHISMLIAGGVLLGTRYNAFFEINGTCPKGSEGETFINNGKFSLMNTAMMAHGLSLVLHWMYQLLNHYEVKVVANMCLVSKMVLFFISILKIQSSIDFTECADVLNKSQVMAWLTFEVLMFYINLISLSAFIFIQNFKQFKSIRDRVGLAGNARKVQDFLNYSKDDLHWWSAWFNQLCLATLALIFKNSTTKGQDIKLSVIELFIKHAFGLFLVR